MLSISVGHNADFAMISDSKYKCNVLYGSIEDFQADVLRRDFKFMVSLF